MANMEGLDCSANLITEEDLESGAFDFLIEEVRSTEISWLMVQDPNFRAYRTPDNSIELTVAQLLNELLENSGLARDFIKSFIKGATEEGGLGLATSLQILKDETEERLKSF